MDRLVAQHRSWSLPSKIYASAPSSVQVLEPDGVGFSIGKVHGGLDHRAPFPGGLVFTGHQELAIEKQPEPFRVFARIAVVHADAQLVVVRRRWSEGAAPAHRVVVRSEERGGQ